MGLRWLFFYLLFCADGIYAAHIGAQGLRDADAACLLYTSGCPAPKIVNNGEGSALMKEPRLAGEIICALKKAVKNPVTAKFRKGFDAAHANCVLFAEVV